MNETIFHDLSDHCLVSSFNLSSTTERRTLEKNIADHRRLNYQFHEFMIGLPRDMPANEKLTAVITNYNNLVMQSTKTVTTQAKIKGHCPWITFDLWTMMRWKENLLNRKKKNPLDKDVAGMLSHVSRMLQLKKDRCKREYYQKLLLNCSQKSCFLDLLRATKLSPLSTNWMPRNVRDRTTSPLVLSRCTLMCLRN